MAVEVIKTALENENLWPFFLYAVSSFSLEKLPLKSKEIFVNRCRNIEEELDS